MNRTLDPQKIIDTLRKLQARIAERFPGSGLLGVAGVLTRTAEATSAEVARIAHPNVTLRFLVGLLIALFAAIVVWLGAQALGLEATYELTSVMQGIDAGVSLLIVADSDFGPGAHDPDTVARLRRAGVLVVLGWADTPLARAADLALPIAHHGEKEGTFVNNQYRLQRFRQAFPPPGDVRSGVEALAGLLRRLDPAWQAASAAEVFALLAAEVPAFAGLAFARIPPTGVPLPGVEATVPG